MNPTDTIVAISTPAGVGGIAVIRLSGPHALPIATRHLTPNSKLQTPNSLTPRIATYCQFDDIDDVLALYYPHGYTGEPTVEISCHGSLYIQQAILQSLIDSGARLAEPGEFTMRAFRNGRLNLSQAEAVADLIDAVTPAQHRLAVSQLRGGYAQKLKELRQQLLDLTSLLELELDFSQEDVEFADRTQLKNLLSTLNSQLSTLISSFRLGNALKRGIPVAIVGKPNAGKSSLLNALLGDERAIVSDIPGTTRDTIEETLTIGGITFRFIDTAGLRHSTDTVEALGIERSLKAIAEAEIVLLVHDVTTPWQDPDPDLDLSTKKVIIVLNKSDLLPSTPDLSPSTPPTSLPHPSHIPPTSHLSPFTFHLSSKTGLGLPALKQAMLDAVEPQAMQQVLLSNPRHCEAMRQVLQALEQVSQGLDSGLPADLLAVDLRDALYHLGSITGDVTSDDILSNIFSRFCIGK